MLNRITIEGNLGAAPEVKTTNANKCVANMRIAHNSYWKDKKGEDQKKTTWFNVEVWDKLAKVCESFGKGNRLIVMGRTETDPRKDDKGNHYENLKIIATDIRKVESLSKGRDKEEQGTAE